MLSPSRDSREGRGAAALPLVPPAVRAGVVVIVPAYNEAAAIGETVHDLAAASLRVVVIDDGSRDDTAAVARRAGATVLRHLVNRGQGAALQTGISYVLRHGAKHIITFDADGQHGVEAIPALLQPLLDGRAEVVLGSRFLDGQTKVPLLRRLTLKAAVIFTRVASGMRVTDTHNGLRAFTRGAAEQIALRQDRMAHASEILDQIAAAKLRYVEVPVRIRYSDYARRKGQSSLGAFRVALDYLLGRWLG
jgi:glycosyltransferase involved in cell wall biosynthesis